MFQRKNFPLIFTFLFLFACNADAQWGEEESTVIVGAARTEAYIPILRGKAVGVVCNHTSLIGETHLVDSLLSRNVRIKKIFSPEHGFRGNVEDGAQIDHSRDTRTRLPIVSLYGSNKRPNSAQLANLDIMVLDLQDVGVRFYTYISTMHYVMEACAENGVPLMILDRPNPNGKFVENWHR